MQRGHLTKDDVERFEGELGKLMVVKKALEQDEAFSVVSADSGKAALAILREK